MTSAPPPSSQAQDRRALLAELLRRKASTPESSFPLSHGQQGIWFLCRQAPSDPAYHVSFTARISAALEPGVLCRALEALLQRHRSLRTVFREREGQPFQVVLGEQPLSFEQIDARGQDWEEIRRRAADLLKRPFDLERGPLFRATLFSRSPSEHVLLLAMHHLVCDGWSYWMMLDELRRLYAAGGDTSRAGLPPLSHTYEDFVRWQAQRLAGPEGERLWAYWREQLAGPLPELQLPTDWPRQPGAPIEGASVSFRLSPELSEGLRALARAEGVTLYIMLLAGFQVLLHRVTSQRDLLVGSPMTGEGRSRAEFSGVVGFMLDTLVLRGRLEPTESFRAHLARTRQAVHGALDHQGLPLPLLTERLRPQRTGADAALFQVLFALQRPHQFEEVIHLLTPGEQGTRVDVGGLPLEPFELPQQESQRDLWLELWDARPTLSGTFKYNARLFERATVERMVGHFQTMLESILADPSTPLERLPMLTPRERHQLLVEWNQQGESFSGTACMHELFDAQARETPHAVAVVAGGERVTYAELDRRSSQLAARLRALGVGPEARVGVCLGRDADLITALLAILKAGAAYVPLDPAYPPERLRFMLEDSSARLTMTRPEYAPLLQGTASQLVDVGANSTEEALRPAAPSGVTPSHLAYIIYTSGSTGRPKGVAIEHRSAVAFLAWARDVFGPEQRAGILASTSVCFDLSIFEIFLPLTTGGKIVLADNALALPSLEGADEVTLINTVPSAMAELVAGRGVPDSVRTVNLAGEALHRKLVEDIYQSTRAEQVYNLYGPSEDTTYSTFALMDREQRRSPPIGRPVRHTRAYVLDGRLQPVPVGVPGELFVGGSGLARGYLGRPERTAERFIPDPFSAEPGARMYRTGDLARYLADGTLEYLGRVDHQVKIRGFRIELGEVEQVAARFPGVGEIAVKAESDPEGRPYLVAYVSPVEGHAVSLPELRAFLKEKLPAHFVPTVMVPLEAMPRTPNGKIDRGALKPPERSADPLVSGARPRGPIEEVIASIFSELLPRAVVGRDTDFFEQGGHSLLVARAVSRIRQSLGVELPLRALFDAPTVAELARRIESTRSGGTALPPITREEGGPDAPLSLAQQRLWFLHQLDASPVYHMPFALRLTGRLDPALLERCLGMIVQRHEALRTRFPEANGGTVQRVLQEPGFSFRLVDREVLGLEDEQQEQRWVEEEARRPFDLTTGPLLRVTLVRGGEETWLLLLVLHHLVSDGWSMRVLADELSRLYALGESAHLPELPVRYADFARWQRQWLEGPALNAGVESWRTQLQGAPLVLELPTRRPRTALQTFRGRQSHFTLEPELCAAVRELGQRAGATPYMTLLSAFAVLLARFSRQEELLIGSPSACRRPETEPLIGFFVNLLPMRFRLGDNPPFLELLARTRAAALEAYTHQDVPFDRIVEALGIPRTLERSPLFQVAFSVQEALSEGLRLPGLSARQLPVDTGTSRFDLTLLFEEQGPSWSGVFEYNSDLFDEETIVRLGEHLRTLLAALVAEPGRRVWELPLLSAAEQAQVLAAGCGPAPTDVEEALVHERFEAWAQRTPEAIALVHGERSFSYAALNAQAERLATQLAGLGVGPEVLVGVCMERCPEAVLGALAILKAGGAYLPLDPTHPPERLRAMLREAAVPVVLTRPGMSERLSDMGATVLCPEITSAPVPSEEPRASRPRLSPRHLAYAIYTSGSSGAPKGVLVSHGALRNLVRWHQRAFSPTPSDRATQLAGVGFDASIWELWPYLASGASVHQVSPEIVAAPGDLRSWLRAQAISLAFVPTPVAEQLLEGGWDSEGAPRYLLTGGDALHRYAPPGLRLVNNYGPTENAVVATSGLVPEQGPLSRPSLGRAIDGTRVYVLDRRLRPVPFGFPGEIFLGGESLARGYLRRPELTAERFMPDPFASEPGARLYRTGDLARMLPNGELEFLGRIDAQVKLRGYRIEPGEIEANLLAHSEVREAVVVHSRGPGEERLVAYVAPARPGEASVVALRAHLRERLPEYMIPGAFVLLERLPLNASGKVDRRALPAPEASPAATSEVPSALPRTEVEHLIADAWREVLRLERVGIHDNFFDLGGHSLRLATLRSKLQERLGLAISMIDLFQYPTIHALAGHLASRRQAPAEQTGPAPGGRGARRELARGQRELRVGQRTRTDS